MRREQDWRECPVCKTPVHWQGKRCKGCGGPSPWADAVKPVPDAQAPVLEPVGLGPHIILRDFRQYIGDVMVAFTKGKVITDERVIGALLDANAPVIAVEDVKTVVTCPSCFHVFKMPDDPAKK